jgi:5-methylcytosine-specific restriction endonuclease McrA
MREWQRQHKADTGEWYHRGYVEQQRESDRRRRDARKAEGQPSPRQLRPATYAKSDAKRRMQKVAATLETFEPREIFERDQWTCQLCQRPVDDTIAWPAPLSPSLDHIVPISKGGDHSRANSRLAHLACNSSRGNRGDDEQLMLIG